MQLWNDYEGKTIADTYSLGPLLRPEGRSALFALPRGADAPAIIRLTEAINDEGQMIACWTRVAELHQENLLAIKRFGETNFEGTHLTYAVMEPTDANLADLLKERPLTHAEALQVAASLTAALTAIHAQGLVHQHIDASNVLAVGETVKLRTDCVSQCVVEADRTTEEDCHNLRQRDVADLATLLLRALTLEKKLTPAIRLRAPFDRIIPNGLNGAWGLSEIAAALAPPAAAAESAPKSTLPQLELPLDDSAPPPAESYEPLRYRRTHSRANSNEPRLPIWVGVVALALVVLVLGLHAITGKPANKSIAASQPIPSAQTAAAPVPTPHVVVAPENRTAVPAHVTPGWYVVAYTFNRIDQAQKRADAIAKRYPDLNPQVIAPGGRSPYLIALRGSMTRPEAEALRSQALKSGLPRDTFVRNYKGA